MSQSNLRPAFSLTSTVLLLLLLCSVACCLFLLFGTRTRAKKEQARQSKAITRVQPRQPNGPSKNDIKGATKKVPAPDPHTQIP